MFYLVSVSAIFLLPVWAGKLIDQRPANPPSVSSLCPCDTAGALGIYQGRDALWLWHPPTPPPDCRSWDRKRSGGHNRNSFTPQSSAPQGEAGYCPSVWKPLFSRAVARGGGGRQQDHSRYQVCWLSRRWSMRLGELDLVWCVIL